MSTAPLSQALHLNPLYFTTLQTKNTLHKSRLFIPHHYTSHHFTYLHSPLTWIPLFVTTFLTLFLKVLNLQGKDASRLAGNWFQLVMVLFTKEYYIYSCRTQQLILKFTHWSVTSYWQHVSVALATIMWPIFFTHLVPSMRVQYGIP